MTRILLLSLLLGAGYLLSACSEGPAENAGERIDEVSSDVRDDLEEAGDAARDAAEDAGDAIEDAADEAEDELDDATN